MRPQLQTLFGGKDAPDAEKGNCFTACIASILEADLSTFPNFVLWLEEDDHGDLSWRRVQDYLHKRFGVTILYSESPERRWLPEYVLTIASGPGPRGHRHSVVHDGNGLVHDPHPSGAGLLEVETHDLILVSDIGFIREFGVPNSMESLREGTV